MDNQFNSPTTPAVEPMLTSGTERKAKTGFVLGLVGIIAWVIPLIGLPVTICGIVFSSKGLKSTLRKKAVAGLVLSIIFLVLTLVNSFLGAMQGMERELNKQNQQNTDTQ